MKKYVLVVVIIKIIKIVLANNDWVLTILLIIMIYFLTHIYKYKIQSIHNILEYTQFLKNKM